MIRSNSPRRAVGMAMTTALAGAMLVGCSGMPGSHVASAASPKAERAEGNGTTRAHSRAIAAAEKLVRDDPRNAAHRAALGGAYLDAGRFASAGTSFDDAMKLGDTSPRTVLSLALAWMGQGRMREAASLINQHEGEIATADLGLALSLAGQPDRGIHLMSDAIRSGENTPKMRQNLAYAYALAGRWREARLMVAQDVPADKVGDRIQQWAELSVPEAWHHRVATMLGVPAGVRDAGQPAMLALANSDDGVLVAEAASQAAPADTGELPPVASAASISEPAPHMSAMAELPPLHPAAPVAVAMAAHRPEMAAPAAVSPAPPRNPAAFAQAFAPQAAARAPLAAPVQEAGRRAAGEQAARAAPRSRTAVVAAATPAPARADAAGGSHRVQLGSFRSEQSARRAWSIYTRNHPDLAGHKMVITEAVVNGKRYWRVAAAGFGPRDSSAMCGRIKARGQGCIAYAQGRPLPGAVDGAIRMARR